MGAQVVVRLADVAPVAGQRDARPCGRARPAAAAGARRSRRARCRPPRPRRPSSRCSSLEHLDQHGRVVGEDLGRHPAGAGSSGLYAKPSTRPSVAVDHRVVAGLVVGDLGGHHRALGPAAEVGRRRPRRSRAGRRGRRSARARRRGRTPRSGRGWRNSSSALPSAKPSSSSCRCPAAGRAAAARRGCGRGPTAAVRDLLLERRALVLHRQPDVVDAAVREVRQREVDEPVDAGERQRRLGPLAREDVHPAAGAAGLDDGEHAVTAHSASWHATGHS